MKNYLEDFDPQELLTQPINIQLPEEVWRRLELVADARGLSLDQHLESMVHEYIFYDEDRSDDEE